MEYDDDDMEYEYDEDEDMNNIKLKCTKWISDKHVFDLPKDITFSDEPQFAF
jgi:hypothetical protein